MAISSLSARAANLVEVVPCVRVPLGGIESIVTVLGLFKLDV
jgi:hypothetical protein